MRGGRRSPKACMVCVVCVVCVSHQSGGSLTNWGREGGGDESVWVPVFVALSSHRRMQE